MQALELESWVRRWRGPLVGFLAGRGLDPHTAAEAAEETFAEAWVGRDRFAGDPANDRDVGAWLRGIALNRARTGLRLARRHGDLESAPEPASAGGDAGQDGGEDAEARARQARLRQAVQDLPDRERHAVLAFYFGEATTAQVAALLDTSPRAVEGLLHRARKRLAAGAADART